VDYDFSIDQLIAKAPALRWFYGVATGVRIAVYEAGIQNTGVLSVHLGDQPMWLEPYFSVDAMGTSSVENAIKKRRRCCRCAQCADTDAHKHDGDARL
jgi:hypothetical protein